MEWLIPYKLEHDEPDVDQGRLPVEPKTNVPKTPAAGGNGACPKLHATDGATADRQRGQGHARRGPPAGVRPQIPVAN